MRVAEVNALYRVADAIARATGLDDLLAEAVDALVEATDADRASVLLFDDTGVMRFRAWHGLSDEYRARTDGHSLPARSVELFTRTASRGPKVALPPVAPTAVGLLPGILVGVLPVLPRPVRLTDGPQRAFPLWRETSEASLGCSLTFEAEAEAEADAEAEVNRTVLPGGGTERWDRTVCVETVSPSLIIRPPLRGLPAASLHAEEGAAPLVPVVGVKGAALRLHPLRRSPTIPIHGEKLLHHRP